jgi:hypothetical protein
VFQKQIEGAAGLEAIEHKEAVGKDQAAILNSNVDVARASRCLGNTDTDNKNTH